MQTPYILRNSTWQHAARPVVLAMVLALGSALSSGPARSEGNEALVKGQSVKAVIDFRTGDPKKALIYLTLIGDTYKDRDIRAATAHPEFVVSLGGESVKLLANDLKGYSAEEQKTISQVRSKISALARDGIKFDYCTYGGKLFGVAPEQVPGVRVVDNGWDSLIGYQARGYSLVPAF